MLVMSKSSKKRVGSRHKPRKPISFAPRLYEQLAKLAERNDRPISWEARAIIQRALEAEGLWPPPSGQDQ